MPAADVMGEAQPTQLWCPADTTRFPTLVGNIHVSLKTSRTARERALVE